MANWRFKDAAPLDFCAALGSTFLSGLGQARTEAVLVSRAGIVGHTPRRNPSLPF